MSTSADAAPELPELPELRWSSAPMEDLGTLVVVHSPDDETIRAAGLARPQGAEPDVAAIGRLLEQQMDTLERLDPATADREMNPLPTDRGAVAEAVAAYAAGDLTPFDALAVAQPGPEFRQQVWAALREVPAGETVSYAELAVMAGRPQAHRAAASACAHNQVGFAVPCHRVILADGSIGGYGFGGVGIKRALLAREGVHL